MLLPQVKQKNSEKRIRPQEQKTIENYKKPPTKSKSHLPICDVLIYSDIRLVLNN